MDVTLHHLVRGVVEEDVDTTQVLQRLHDNFLAVVSARQVGGKEMTLLAVRFHDAFRLLGVLLFIGEIDDKGVGAF